MKKNWKPSVFTNFYEKASPLSYVQPGHLCKEAIYRMRQIARSEGLKVYEQSAEVMGGNFCAYHLSEPAISINRDLSWMEMRNAYAEVLGFHFQALSSDCSQCEARAAWKKAEEWARTFLATFAANVSMRLELPVNHGHVPGAEKRWKAERELKTLDEVRKPQFSDPTKCKATTKRGRPCRARRVKGTPFCHQHRDCELETLGELVQDAVSSEATP